MKPTQKAKVATLNNQMTKEMVSIMYLRQGKLKVVVDVLYPKNVAQSLMSLMMQKRRYAPREGIKCR